MDFVRNLLLLVHLLGFAALFGGAFVQIRDEVKVVNGAMLYGILTQVVTGILLVGVLENQHADVDHAKVAVKFGVALVIAVLCWVNRSRLSIPGGLFGLIALLTVANAAVAVFW